MPETPASPLCRLNSEGGLEEGWGRQAKSESDARDIKFNYMTEEWKEVGEKVHKKEPQNWKPLICRVFGWTTM